MHVVFKILLSASLISFSSWLAGKKPSLAGFLISLPISSMIAIALTQNEWKDPEKSVAFAKSILFSIPLSLTFFLPFLWSKQLKLPFWGTYASGVILIFISYWIHQCFFSDAA